MAEFIRQENSLLNFAEGNGLISNEVIESLSGCRNLGGAEHLVFSGENEKSIIKVTLPDRFGRKWELPSEYLERLCLYNEIVPNTAIEVVGVYKRVSGVGLITAMPFIPGIHPPQGILNGILTKWGFESLDDPNSSTLDYVHHARNLIIRDAHPGNFKLFRDELIPIDVWMEKVGQIRYL